MGVWVSSFRKLFVYREAGREVVSVVSFGVCFFSVQVFLNLSKFYCLPQKGTVQCICYGALFCLEFKFSGGLWWGGLGFVFGFFLVKIP